MKKHTVVVFTYNDPRSAAYSKPRLGLVKSYRAKDNTVNITFAMYKRSSIFSDIRVSADSVVAVDVPSSMFYSLARCLPQPDLPNCPVVAAQHKADAAFPQYAAMRKQYGPYESISEGIARIRAAA